MQPPGQHGPNPSKQLILLGKPQPARHFPCSGKCSFTWWSFRWMAVHMIQGWLEFTRTESSGTKWLYFQADRGRFGVGDPPSVMSICCIRGCLHETTYFRIPQKKKEWHFLLQRKHGIPHPQNTIKPWHSTLSKLIKFDIQCILTRKKIILY